MHPIVLGCMECTRRLSRRSCCPFGGKLVLYSHTRSFCHMRICLPLSFITMMGAWKLASSCHCTWWSLWFTFSFVFATIMLVLLMSFVLGRITKISSFYCDNWLQLVSIIDPTLIYQTFFELHLFKIGLVITSIEKGKWFFTFLPSIFMCLSFFE